MLTKSPPLDTTWDISFWNIHPKLISTAFLAAGYILLSRAVARMKQLVECDLYGYWEFFNDKEGSALYEKNSTKRDLSGPVRVNVNYHRVVMAQANNEDNLKIPREILRKNMNALSSYS